MSSTSAHNVIALICLSPRKSTRIPNKNFRKIGNKSLAEWAVYNAKRCGIDDIRIVVEDNIANKWARELGVKALVTPEIPNRTNWTSEPILMQAASIIEGQLHGQKNIYVNLQATCPFIEKDKLVQGIQIVIDDVADSIVTLNAIPGLWWHYEGEYVFPIGWNPLNRPRSQEHWPVMYKASGHFSVFNKRSVIEGIRCGGRVKPIIINPDYFVDIDDMNDLILARQRFGIWKENELGGKI